MSLEFLSTIIGCTCVSVLIQEGWILIAFTSCKTSHNSLSWGQGGGRVVVVVGLLTVEEGGSEKWRVSRIYNRGWHLCFP